MNDEASEFALVVGFIAFTAGLIWAARAYGLAITLAVASGVLALVWAVAVIVLLVKILDRLPAAKKAAAAQAREDEPATSAPEAVPSGVQFSPGLYEIKRDDHGRILADE